MHPLNTSFTLNPALRGVCAWTLILRLTAPRTAEDRIRRGLPAVPSNRAEKNLDRHLAAIYIGGCSPCLGASISCDRCNLSALSVRVETFSLPPFVFVHQHAA